VIVTSCKVCPFRQDPFLGGVLALFRDVTEAFCGYDRTSDELVVVEFGMKPGTARDQMVKRAQARMPIPDVNTIPDSCPLRGRDVRITLGD